MEIKFTDENINKLNEIIKRYPDKQAALLPALWIAQEQFGWISIDVIKYVGKKLDIPYEKVFGVVQFYTMFNKKQVGKYHIQVCTNVSCMLRGAYDLLNYVSNKLNVKPGDTTTDGSFTLSEVECLGSCGTAPTVQINNFYEENLDKNKLDKIISELLKT